MWLYNELQAQRPYLFLWTPLFVACGIGVYFTLPVEPPFILGAIAFLTTLSCFILGMHTKAHIPLLLMCLVTLGFTAVQIRTNIAHTDFVPRDEQTRYIKGTITTIEDMGKDSRITLSDLTIEDIEEDKTPRHIRLRLREDDNVQIGQKISALARLHKPSAPVLPGGFDFRRHMYFEGIGAVGFIFNEPEIIETPVNKSFKSTIESLRHKIAQTIEQNVQYPQAGIAIALTTGRKTAIDNDTNEAMRAAGLAHMLAISGLHVGLFSGTIFFIVRLIMALIPGFALHHPIKKYAAVIAIICAIFYALLAGMNIPTQRALLMVTMAFIAILLDRSPISLRLVTFAALSVLLLFPESILSASFHMSFAAVVCLIVFYDRIRPLWSAMHRKAGVMRRIALYFIGVSMTTVIASLATAPFALYHFHQMATYSILANFIAVPILGFIIMPCIILTLFLMPLGLSAIPLLIIQRGITAILDIATWTTSLPHSVLHMAQWPLSALLCITLGTLFLFLWRGRLALFGFLPILISIPLIAATPKPDILISPDMDLIGVYDQQTLYISDKRKNRFAREIWLESLGLTEDAAQSWPKEHSQDVDFIHCDTAACRMTVKDKKISHIKANTVMDEECNWADIAISYAPLWDCKSGIRIDRGRTKKHGAYSIYLSNTMTVRKADQITGHRPWTQ